LDLPKDLLLKIHRLMVKSRVLEDRLIKIYKAGDAYFWIGGPGEEAFGVPLGLLIHKGKGPAYDFLHFHYRCSPTLIAMGWAAVGVAGSRPGAVCGLIHCPPIRWLASENGGMRQADT
jgi:TPP-dependent pyruvate/acetoin dehydrogenase alpha subunit